MRSDKMTSREGGDTQYVRSFGIFGLSAYLLIFVGLAVGLIVIVWPGMPARSWMGSISDEARYALIVTAAGIVGSGVNALTSLADYVGNRRLVKSWTLWYVSRVFIGGALALIFYLVIRGSLISPQADVRDINLFSITAIAALVGMFSQFASHKLTSVFATLFGSTAPDENRLDQLTTALGIATLDNYDGFLCLSFENESGESVSLEDGTPTLNAEQFYDLVLWFQPKEPVEGAAKKIEITSGVESRNTEFSVAPSGDSFTLRPSRVKIPLDVTKPSPKERFKLRAPKNEDPYEIWIEVSQKSRVVYMTSLTFLVQRSQGGTSEGISSDEPALT